MRPNRRFDVASRSARAARGPEQLGHVERGEPRTGPAPAGLFRAWRTAVEEQRSSFNLCAQRSDLEVPAWVVRQSGRMPEHTRGKHRQLGCPDAARVSLRLLRRSALASLLVVALVSIGRRTCAELRTGARGFLWHVHQPAEALRPGDVEGDCTGSRDRSHARQSRIRGRRSTAASNRIASTSRTPPTIAFSASTSLGNCSDIPIVACTSDSDCAAAAAGHLHHQRRLRVALQSGVPRRGRHHPVSRMRTSSALQRRRQRRDLRAGVRVVRSA